MKKASTSPGPHYQALLQLLRTSETLWNASRVFFSKWDLSPSQFNILNLLSDAPEGLSQIELSRLLIMHRSNVTGLVDRLEERKLIKRQSMPDDRRAYRVVLTPGGTKLINRILPDYYRAAEEIWARFPVTRTKQFTSDLLQLSQNVAKFSETMREP